MSIRWEGDRRHIIRRRHDRLAIIRDALLIFIAITALIIVASLGYQ